jgi:hypothetical protein
MVFSLYADNIMFIVLILCILLVSVVLLGVSIKGAHEGFLSPFAGPVDMLQLPKQVIMDGYRFQDTLFAPEEANYRQVTYLCPTDRQRVGIFKEKSYLNQEGGNEAALLQMKAVGEVDRYLLGNKGDPVVDNINLLGPLSQYGPPERFREINYPNPVFSWGDVINRYHGQFTLVGGTPYPLPLY